MSAIFIQITTAYMQVHMHTYTETYTQTHSCTHKHIPVHEQLCMNRVFTTMYTHETCMHHGHTDTECAHEHVCVWMNAHEHA